MFPNSGELSARAFSPLCDIATIAKDGFCTTYYVINCIIFDKLEVKFGIDLDDKLKGMLSSLHSDIPFYNLPSMDVYKPTKWENVLNKCAPEVYTDLENILIHMIDEQDDKLYMSDLELQISLNNFWKFLKTAKMWHVTGYVLSWVGTAFSLLTLIMISYWFCMNKHYIKSLIMAHYAAMDVAQDYVVVLKPTQSSPLLTMKPLFTLNPELTEETEK